MSNQVVNNSSNDLSSYLNTDYKSGLNESEVKKRQEIFGYNELKKAEGKNFFQLFIEQSVELLPLLLLFSSIIAFVIAGLEHVGTIANIPSNIVILHFVQAGVLLAIVLINSVFGAFQEMKSNEAIEALQKMSVPKSKVLREGKIELIDSNELTIGDIIIVEAGDTIGADCKIIECSNLKVIESILTGESLPIEKTNQIPKILNESVPIGDRINELFSGCNVVNGRGVAIVTAIGSNTEIGKIATILSQTETIMTPLQLKLHKLGKWIGMVGIVLTFITFIFALFTVESVIDNGIAAMGPAIILAISTAVAIVPEGLGAVVNVVLAIGVRQMSKKNGLIKKLHAVETLGSVAVICSDKTGTLTMNKMTVVNLWTPKAKEADTLKEFKINDEYKKLIQYSALCTDCSVDETDPTKEKIGDPTEIALVDIALNNKISVQKLNKEYKRLADIPFDSDRKLMTTIHKIDNKIIAIVKGAPDILMSRCKKVSELSEAKKINNKWSDNAKRVLAVGIKVLKEVPKKIDDKKIESDLTFIGLIGMIDPPREEVKMSIQECINAGIKPVMITGDHLNTAVAIAKELKIYKDGDLAITGSDLEKMSDDELFNNIHKYSVFARVSPENKIRIVQAWQSKDQVVSMTGDGVNDAPALQAADIGCAMGITGTDVSKGAAAMVLTDDNFSTIVESVKTGRSIYENIKRIVLFLLSTNVSGVIIILLGMIIMYFVFDPKYGGLGACTPDYISTILQGIQNPQAISDQVNEVIKFQSVVSALLILINNIVVEIIPGIFLGMQEYEADFMKRRPRSKFETIFADGLIKKIFIVGLASGIVTMCAFILGVYTAIWTNAPGLRFYYGSIASFITISGCGIAKAFWLSTEKLLVKSKFQDIKNICYSTAYCGALILLVVLIPQVSSLFGERPELYKEEFNNLTVDEFNKLQSAIFNGTTSSSMVNGYIWLSSLSFSLLFLIFLEMYKFIEMKFFAKKYETNISEFKLIEKPLPWYENYKWIKKIVKKSNA